MAYVHNAAARNDKNMEFSATPKEQEDIMNIMLSEVCQKDKYQANNLTYLNI